MFLLVGYLAMFAFVGDPGSTGAQVLVLIPLFTPLFMPMRIAAGETSVPEVVVAAALVGATIVGLAWLAGQIYNRLVLRRGSRVHWLEAIRPST